MLLMGAPIPSILFTVFQSIFQVFLLCLAGFTLSFKGIVDKPISKALNRINIALFTPALLFSKAAFFLTPAKLRQLWVIPIFFFVLTGLSAVIAHWLARACRLKRSQVNFATVASMFMNSNSLPVAVMQSLTTTVPLLKWGPDDALDAMFGRSLTYLAVFSTIGMILRWSYGMHLLSQTDEPESPVAPPPTTYRDVDGTRVSDPFTGQLIDYETEADIDPRNQHGLHPLRSRLPHPCLTPPPRRPTHPRLHSYLPAVPTSLGDQSESEDTDELETTEGDSEDAIALRAEQVDPAFSTEAEDETPAPPLALYLSEPTQRWEQPAQPSFFRRLLEMLSSLSPPLVASLFALFCVLVPPVQRLLKSEEMIPFKGALDSVGACSVPITLLVLGGWFRDGDSKPKSPRSRVEDEIKGGSGDQGHTKRKEKGVKKSNSQHAPHRLISPSRDSSTASLSSMIGANGDVLMVPIHPSRRSDRSRRRVRGTVDGSTIDDVESGLLAMHTEAEIPHAENRHGCASRSRSRTSPVNGRACLSHIFPSSSLHPEPMSPQARATNVNTGETLTIFITLFTRMVVVPLITTPIMAIVSWLGWGGEVFEDPVFIVSSMLLISSPPALALAQISQRAKTTTTIGVPADANAFSPFERLLPHTVFWAYLVLTPPITIASAMVGLLMIGA